MNHDPDRRTLLTVTGATLASATLTGCLSSASPGGSDSKTSTTNTLDNPDATIKVGPEGNLVFEPYHLEVRPGATVRWVWEFDNHNVVVERQPKDANWEGSPGSKTKLYDAGFSFTHTFDILGRYEYYSHPDQSAGMIGEVVVTESPTRTTTPESEAPTESEEEENTVPEEPPTVIDMTGQSEITVAVGPDGTLQFDPAAARISCGTAVTWAWESNTHNVVPESQPDGANWKGTPGVPSKTFDSGYTYTHTFETVGEYEYYCQPHKSAGMIGKLIVE
ncbi:plastocyanin/azurin family copper-binding protein [Haladaptatus salinisoli]|uniref:plastocyanin/azurin family copper-binding protein n=1 Tax=Haladaptatus salinisoli TaxID=2884876 RepID=UPI001D0B9FBF|nr:plastocyanin/azurin family copper-binding protein [Haladaptatus salinisoli]